jgi:hypothetical protein
VTNKSRTAIFVLGFLFAILALGMLFVPSYAGALGAVFALVVAAGLASVANPGRRPSQLTVHDR